MPAGLRVRKNIARGHANHCDGTRAVNGAGPAPRVSGDGRRSDRLFELLRGAERDLLAGLDLDRFAGRRLRPIRAARFLTCRMPSPPMRMRSPFLRCLTILPTRPPRIASACFLEISLSSAMLAARCFSVTVVVVAISPSSMKRWRGSSAAQSEAVKRFGCG